MSDKYAEAMGKRGTARLRKERRASKVGENAILAAIVNPEDWIIGDCYAGSGTTPLAAQENGRRWIGIDLGLPPAASQDAQGASKGQLGPSRPLKRLKSKRKKAPSRKSLVKKADIAFSLHVRALYPTSFFSGKPTECCFHIITRGKHSVRWVLDNAVGSTMGENYEMEFNPHKFISILIQKRGLLWYETLIRRSNEIRKHTRADLEMIAARGYE